MRGRRRSRPSGRPRLWSGVGAWQSLLIGKTGTAMPTVQRKPMIKVNGLWKCPARSIRRIERVDDQPRIVARVEHAVGTTPLAGEARLDEGVGDAPAAHAPQFGC